MRLRTDIALMVGMTDRGQHFGEEPRQLPAIQVIRVTTAGPP